MLGEDAQAFCEAVIAALPPRSTGERALNNVRDGLLAFVVLGVIWLVSGAIDMLGDRAWPYLPLTLGDVIGQVLILATAFYIFHSLSRHAFDDKLGRLFVLVFVALAVSLLASIYLTTFLCNVHIAVVAGALLVFFAAYKVLDARVD